MNHMTAVSGCLGLLFCRVLHFSLVSYIKEGLVLLSGSELWSQSPNPKWRHPPLTKMAAKMRRYANPTAGTFVAADVDRGTSVGVDNAHAHFPPPHCFGKADPSFPEHVRARQEIALWNVSEARGAAD